MKHFPRILLASDFSQRNHHVEQRILQFAQTGLKELRLLHVLSGSLMEELKRLMTGGTLDQRLQETAMRQMLEQSKRFSAVPGLKVDCQLETGRPHEVIIAHAAETDSLIVIGTHGDHPVRDWFQGGMIERLLANGDQPVLVIKRPADAPYQQILVPVDFSPSSLAAVQAAATITPKAQITLLHVFELPFESKLRFAGISDAELADYQASSKQRAELDMAAFISGLPDMGVKLSSKLVHGYAPAVILEQAEELACDLIVMGRYGRSGVKQLLLGSVTEYVATESLCDVMVVSG